VEFTERFPADRPQRFNSPLLRRWSKLKARLMAAGRQSTVGAILFKAGAAQQPEPARKRRG